MTTDRQGNLLVNDRVNGRLQLFDRNGKFLAKYPHPATAKEFLVLFHLAMDELGNIYSADNDISEVYLIRNGKIASLIWVITSESLERLKPALATALPPAPTATPAPAPATPATDLTMTIAGGRCPYDGPMTLPTGLVTVTLDVKDQDKTAYALTFFSPDSGKTLADLMPETLQAAPPAWADMFGATEAGLPGQSITFNMVIERGPVYGICWSKPPDLPIGTLGPFEVSR